MKITSWTTATILGLASLVTTSGCATTKATSQQVAGLSAQQLIPVADTQQSNTWLPKLPFAGSAPKPKPNARSTSVMNDAASDVPLAKGNKKQNDKTDFMAIARLNERRGNFELAKQIYQRELEKNPKNGEVHHRMAIIAAKENNWDKANQHFQVAEQLMPNNSELLADLGYALYLQHRLETAEACLKNAIAINPQNMAAHNNLGIVLGVQGKFEEGFSEFKRVGSAAEAHTNMAYVYAQLGDIDQAIANLDRALSLDSNLKVAALELIQLNDLKKRYEPATSEANSLVQQKPVPEPSTPGVFKRQIVTKADIQQPQLAKSVEPSDAAPRSNDHNSLAQSVASGKPQRTDDRRAAGDVEGITDSRSSSSRRSVASSPMSAQPSDSNSLSKPAPSTESVARSAALPPWAAEKSSSTDGAALPMAPASTIQAGPPAEVAVSAVRPSSRRGAPAMTVEATALAPIVRAIKTPLEAVALGSQPLAPHASPVVNPNVAAANRQKSLVDEWTWLDQNASRAEPTHEVVAIANADSSASQIQPASAQVPGSSRKLVKTALPDPAQAADQPVNLAPIVSPSQRMQDIRTAERKQEAERVAAGVTLRLPPSAAARTGPATAASTPEPDSRDDSRWMLPSMQPSIPTLSPDDLVPTDSMVHVAGDSAAQSKGSSGPQSSPSRTSAPAVNAMSNSRLMPSLPDYAANRGPAGAQAALQHFDESQFAGLPLPKKY